MPVVTCLIFGAAIAYSQTDIRVSPRQINGRLNCDERGRGFCLDRYTRQNYEGEYVGHDEPSVIFYSSIPGSGNQAIYTLVLPKDPPIAPKQDGTGGTYNFQLHPTFWFGMALCDTQSAPAPDPNSVCVPSSDANIKNSASPNSPDYLGKHAGTAFLELQFYPPGWINSPGLVASNVYFAALNIDSFSFNMNTGTNNNLSCLEQVGQEPVNFAVLTNNGVPLLPANPLGAVFGNSSFDFGNVFVMNPGDTLRVTITDTPSGLLTLVQDLSTGQIGFMVANPNAGFGQVDYSPAGNACTVTPYTFHPMYSTSSESTRVPWAVHSYNVAFSDEIGHFEFCNAFNSDPNSPNFLQCTSPGAGLKLDADDAPCANPSFFGLPSSFVPLTGCVGEDVDFDGTSYNKNWPGTNPVTDALYHPTPIRFSSPVFHPTYIPPGTQLLNFDRVAFETNLPSFESCDPKSGTGCQNLPAGANFYPIYSTWVNTSRQCFWQFGGPSIPGTQNNFGGTATTEFGDLYPLAYPVRNGPTIDVLNFRQVILNPCQVLNP